MPLLREAVTIETASAFAGEAAQNPPCFLLYTLKMPHPGYCISRQFPVIS